LRQHAAKVYTDAADRRPAAVVIGPNRANQTQEALIATEVELKLSAKPADLSRLERMLSEMVTHSGSSKESLTSTYYDTPDWALRRNGLTLRVRENGGYFIQTVKAAAIDGDHILARGEWEDAVAGNRPDVEAPRSGAPLQPVATGDLRAIFITDVTRSTVEIEPSLGTEIAAAIDRGEIRTAGGQSVEPIAEIELELKDGDAAALYDLALGLVDVAPLRIETRSKAERGYRLMVGRDAAAPAVHAQPVALEPDMTVEDALQRIGNSCLAQLLPNEAAVLSSQPEGLHQMRVAVRRIRSAILSFKEMLSVEDRRWIAEDLGWLARTLGPARNLDVFATELLPAARAGLPDEPGWDDLGATLDRLRRAAYERSAETILSERFTTAMLHLLRWFEARGWRDHTPSENAALLTSPIGEVAPRVLDHRQRGVRHRSRQFGRLTPRGRHKLRIATKKLRYTIELFDSLFDNHDLRKFVSGLKRLQDDLGYANDVRVAHQFVTELFAETEPRGPAAHAWVTLLEWHDQILAGREQKLRKHLRRLNSASPFWRD
jgi:inorganic triphosphatase YgiF